MSFDLFGFDFLISYDLYGAWFCSFENDEGAQRSLFGVYYANDCWFVDILFIHII